MADFGILWLTNFNLDICREDFEENLPFYAEEIEEDEAELTQMRPELIARWRKRIKIPRKPPILQYLRILQMPQTQHNLMRLYLRMQNKMKSHQNLQNLLLVLT